MLIFKNRFFLVLDDDLYKQLLQYRAAYDSRRYYSWRHKPTPMSSVIIYILRDYFKQMSSDDVF